MQPVAEDEDVQSGKHLIFQIGSDMFGIKICFIKEIIGGMLPSVSSRRRQIMYLGHQPAR